MYVSAVAPDYARRTHYSYSGTLAASAIFVPPAGTLVYVAYLLYNVGAVSVHSVWDNRSLVSGAGGAVPMPTYCDGVHIGFMNPEESTQTLKLEGISL